MNLDKAIVYHHLKDKQDGNEVWRRKYVFDFFHNILQDATFSIEYGVVENACLFNLPLQALP